VVAEFGVNFDADLPEYRTKGGVHRGTDGLTVTSPPVMWAAALDLLFDRMRAAISPSIAWPLSRVPGSSTAACTGGGERAHCCRD